MRGQLGFEFYFALVTFVMLTIFIFFQLISYYPEYFRQLEYQELKAETWQISELLVNDPGEPINWQTNPEQAKRLGLNDEQQAKTNLLSVQKARAFDNLCDDEYDKLLEKLSTSRQVSVFLVDNESNVLISCSATGKVSRNVVNLTRIVGLNNGRYGDLVLQVS